LTGKLVTMEWHVRAAKLSIHDDSVLGQRRCHRLLEVIGGGRRGLRSDDAGEEQLGLHHLLAGRPTAATAAARGADGDAAGRRTLLGRVGLGGELLVSLLQDCSHSGVREPLQERLPGGQGRGSWRVGLSGPLQERLEALLRVHQDLLTLGIRLVSGT